MRKSIDWKVGIFGLIALILTLGLFSGSAQAAIVGKVTSGTVIAGSMGNTITITITLSGDELNENVTVVPPSGWSSMSDTAGEAGYTTATGGSVSSGNPQTGITIDPNADAVTITVVYGRGGGSTGVTVGDKIGLTEFTFGSASGSDTDSGTDFIVVTVNGSGTVAMTEGTQQNVMMLTELAGVTGRNFEFLYTAVSSTVILDENGEIVTRPEDGTVTEQNVDTLDNGELALQIPAGWPAPTMGNITVETPDPDGDDGLTPTETPLVAGSVGQFSISGSGPWTISVPIIGLDGQQQIKIKYNNITVPLTTGTFYFPASVRGTALALTPISVATDSGSLEIKVDVAGRGSGTMTVSGGPVSAGSTRNTLEFIYSPAGSLDGGGLELVPPLAANGDPLWTEPQGAPGSAGYTTVWIKPAGTASFVQFTAGHGSVNFGEDKGEKRPDFTGKGIGILFNRLKVGDQIRIIYGDGGGNNGATAPETTGLSFFDVYTAPSFSDDALPIGNADGNAGDAKFGDAKRPFVSIQSGDGIGTVEITVRNEDQETFSEDRETFAGEKTSLKFTFEADAPMNGGFFSATVDNSWPHPTSANTQVTTTGSTQPPLFLQREVRVPIVFLAGTQTITITYGKDADNRVDAPGVPEDSVFVFKSQGTPGGILSAIPDPSDAAAEPRDFEVKVDQARDGSGIVTIPDAEKKATAGATGKTFNITFKAVGQMDGGQLKASSPDGWSKIKDQIAIQVGGGAQVTFNKFEDDDTSALYDITTLRRDQTVTFIYSNVEVQSTRSNNDGLNNDGDMDENNAEITDEDDEPAVIKVFSRGKSDSANALMEVADTTAKVVIDSALDGTGTGTITVTDREPTPKTIEADNVPAAHKVRLRIEYEAIGEIGKPSDDPLRGDDVDNNADDEIDEDGERAGGTVRVTIPTAFTTPVKPVELDGIDNDGNGSIDDETPDLEQIGRTTFSVSNTAQPTPTLQIFGRVLTFEGVSLADEEKLIIEIDNMDTPADASTYIFTIEVQGRPAVDADRSLVAIAPSPVVTTGNVVGGKGEAEILVPAKNDDDEHVLIAGATGTTVTIEFKAVGPMDGGLVQVSVPTTGWTIPQGTPGQAGYVTVVPESGVSIGQIGFTPGLNTFSIPIVTIRKDQKLTITYGAGGGASGATVSMTPTDARFTIKTQMPGAKPNHDETVFASLPELLIKVERLEGSGTVAVSPTTAVQGATNNYRFQYTAAGNIGAISIRKPADGWPDFKHPSSTSSAGRISVSRGDIETPTADAPNATILLNNLNLSAGQTVTINYTNVTDSGIGIPPATPRIGKNIFEVGASASAEATTTTTLDSGGADVFIVSADGTGKVAGDSNTSQDSVTNTIITNDGAGSASAVRAGGKTSRTFFYNLGTAEFVKGGEVEIIVPNGWTRPAMSGDGKVVIEQVTSGGATITPALADDAKPTLTIRGQSIIVAIKEMDSGQSIKITYGRDGTEDNATAPTISGDSEFLVRSKTRAAGVRTPIAKNRVLTTQDAKVIVRVVDGASGSGRARSTLPGTVHSGSTNNTITFTFTATAQLSDPAAIRLDIPAGWAVPNDTGGDQAAGTANVTITSSIGSGIKDDSNDNQRDELDADMSGTLAGGSMIEVPIDSLPSGQRITIIYGDGDNKAEAQGALPTPGLDDDGVAYAKFIMSSRGGESGDDFMVVGDPEDGVLKTIIGNAADGSLNTTTTIGTVTEQGTVLNRDDNAPDDGDDIEGNQVYAADTGIEITFTVVASGTMDGGAIRIVPPLGWTTPQGSPGVAGFTQEDTPGGKLGLPAFDGVGAVFNTVDFDVSDTAGVTIKYGSGGDASGATSPLAKATGDDAPKFRIETKGSSDGVFALAKEIPIHIVNARDGTGSAEFVIDTAGAGEKRDYQIRYTAKGTMDEGAIRLTIPEGWSVSDGEEKVVVTSSGDIDSDNIVEAFIDTDGTTSLIDGTTPNVTVPIEKLGPGQTITITLKEARAQSNKPTPDSADADEIPFRFEASRVPFTQSQTTIVGDKELMDDAQPKIKLKQAADGSGTMVAMVVRSSAAFDIDTNAVGIDVVKVGEEPGDLYFVFTAVGTMLGKSQITLDIPEGWTAPLKDDGSDAGDITIEGTAASKIMGNPQPQISEIIGRTAIATVMETASLISGETVIFRYKTPTAPTAAAAYTFTAKSRSQEEGSPMALSEGSPVITVSPPGNGSGAMVLDKTSAAAAEAGVVIKFTFTAAEAMSGGEVRVELPSTWSASKDNIKDEADTANRVTFRDPARANDVSYVASFVDNDRTIVIPVASLGIRNQITFTYTGTVQNTAGTAIIITSTRTSNTGTPVSIATPPLFTVNNAQKGTGTVAYLSGPIASASSGNQLTFDFKAVGTMNGGAVSMEVPPDWSAPQLTQGVAGYTSALTPAGGSVGQLSVSETSDRVVIVPINTLGPDQIVKIIYGRGSGSSGAVAQENAGGGTFIFKTKGSSGDDFESIGNQPTVLVTNAPDGSGTMTVAPTSVTAGSIVEFVFTYMPAGTINGGKLQLTVPSGWTAPLGTAGRGFTTPDTDPGVALGTLSFSDQSVIVPITALTVGQEIRIKYGSGGGNNGVVVPPETGDNTFVVRSQGLTDTQGGQLIELFAAPPVVSITPAGDGSGTATVTAAAAVTAGSTGNNITIVYTAAGPMIDGAVSVEIPAGWSPPGGRTSVSSTGTIGDWTFVEQTVVVEDVTLSANQTITFVYSDATAQGDSGDAVFAVKSQGTDDGTLTALENVAQSALTIVVGNAADGSGTLTIAPDAVVAGGTVDITLTYTTVGTITSGGLRITIPDDWTRPQITDSSAPGFVSAATVTGAVNVPTVGGRLISVFISSLGPNGTIDVSYNSATGPSEVGASTFNAESRGSAPGSFKSLVSGPATIMRTHPSSAFVISSATESTFKGQASDAIVIETRDTDGSRSASASAVPVSLRSSSSTGMFEDASGTVITSTSIPVGATSVSVFYKDTVVGTATLTVTMTLLGETQMATHMITIDETASQLVISSAGEFFAGDALAFTIESQDASGSVAPSINDVTVTLASSSETGSFEQSGNAVTSVTIPANETSATASYRDTTVGMTTFTASATDLTDPPPHEVTVKALITSVESSSSSVMVGGTVTITAIGRPGQTATFSVGDDPDSIFPQDQMMTESTDTPGTYTGDFSPVVDLHPEGMYDVTVMIGDAPLMLPGGLMIDNTDPVLTEAMANPTTIKNGQMLTFTAKSEESGLTVWIDGVLALDSMADDRFDLAESTTEAGTYSASFDISVENTAENGSKTLMAKATDAAGNAAVELPVVVELRNFFEFSLTVPRDISLIHIPLDVNEVDGEAMEIDTVGDLFDALGGTANVSLLITRDTAAGKWRSYLSNQISTGTSADQTITDDMGIITFMKNSVTLSLKGDALGTESDDESASFVSVINLSSGYNLVGVPLKDKRVGKVSALLSLEGIQGNASSIIVSDGPIKVVARANDDGDIAITGGQSFILRARAADTVEITGEAWDNVSDSVATAPPMALVGHKIDGQTPVLAVHGAVIDEIANAAQDGFRVTVKNLSTSSSLNVLSGGDPADKSEGLYSVTFVDTDSSRAARVGDILEITVQTVSPYIGIEPIRHVVTTKDVELGRIRLVDLVTYEIPKETELLPNYPNPFNPETWIPYRLAEDSSVTLTIYDTSGKVVRTIEIGHKPAAVYESRDKAVHWDGRNNYGERVASGIYFYSLSAVNFSATRKMVILK